jgi:hypothetical protein
MLGCPFCGHSDGNDDEIIKKEINYMNNEECQIDIIKECDICRKKYKVEKTFTKSYEKYSYDYDCNPILVK